MEAPSLSKPSCLFLFEERLPCEATEVVSSPLHSGCCCGPWMRTDWSCCPDGLGASGCWCATVAFEVG